MKKQTLYIILVFVCHYTLVIFSQVQLPAPVKDSCKITSDVKYGSSINIKGIREDLLMDIYQPSKELNTKLPLIIYVHGGGFQSNDKVGKLLSRWLTEFTKAGFLCASVNYRLGIEEPKTDTSYFEAMYRGMQDVKAAIRFFRKYAEKYKVDTNMIILMGQSAGAKIALHLAYMREDDVPGFISKEKCGSFEGESGNQGYSSRVNAVVNCWGAMWNYSWIRKGDMPLFSVHGKDDKIVPCDSSFAYHGFKYGSSILNNRAIESGVISGMKLFQNTGHTLDNNQSKQNEAFLEILKWLRKLINNDFRKID